MKLKISRLGIVMIIGFCILAVGIIMPVNAADNITDETNVTNSSIIDENETIEEVTPAYRNTEQYQIDYDYWYSYYTQNRTDNYNSILRENLRSYMGNTALSESEKWDNVLNLMGYDFRLENYLDVDKRTINEETGEITYDLGIINWWANRFNSGVDESKLPQTIAEGEALKDVYYENFKQWIIAIKEIDTE